MRVCVLGQIHIQIYVQVYERQMEFSTIQMITLVRIQLRL